MEISSVNTGDGEPTASEKVVLCQQFQKSATCKYGDNCQYYHLNTNLYRHFQSWTVSKLPSDINEFHIIDAFRLFSMRTDGRCFVQMRTMFGNVTTPHAFLTFVHQGVDALDDASLLSNGLPICNTICSVKRKHNDTKIERVAKMAKEKEEKEKVRQKKQDLKKKQWNWSLLSKFPQRESTLDQHTQMSSLPPELLSLIVEVYFQSRCPKDGVKLVQFLRWVWEKYPLSIKTKELFETMETFVAISQQIGFIQEDVDEIFDLACGHGLLGVLLAIRFPQMKITCVDLKQRPSFHQYLEGSRVCLSNPLNNLTFIEADMTTISIPARSFVICIHACNEANQLAITMATKANAGFAAMPCCIRNGLYCVRKVTHLSNDDSRYMIMVGVMAGVFGAHTITGIDRQITNRNLIMFGGYEMHTHKKKKKEKGKTQVSNSSITSEPSEQQQDQQRQDQHYEAKRFQEEGKLDSTENGK